MALISTLFMRVSQQHQNPFYCGHLDLINKQIWSHGPNSLSNIHIFVFKNPKETFIVEKSMQFTNNKSHDNTTAQVVERNETR